MLNYHQPLIILFIAGFGLLTSCHKEVTANEFLKSMQEDSDFVKSETKEGWTIQCRYVSPRELALREIGRANETQTNNLAEKEKEFKDGAYFEWTFENQSKESPEVVGTNSVESQSLQIQTLESGMQHSFYISSGMQKISPIISQYQKSFAISSKASFLTIFSRSSIQEAGFDLVFEDAVWGIKTPVRFSFSSDIFDKSLPAITTNQS